MTDQETFATLGLWRIPRDRRRRLQFGSEISEHSSEQCQQFLKNMVSSSILTSLSLPGVEIESIGA